MKKSYLVLYSVLAIGLIAACRPSGKTSAEDASSADRQEIRNPNDRTDDASGNIPDGHPRKTTALVGSVPADLHARIDRMLAAADSTADPEFIWLETAYVYYNADYYEAEVRLQAFDPKDPEKKQLIFWSWTDSPKERDRSAHFTAQLLVSNQAGSRPVYPYDSLRGKVFSRKQAGTYIDRLPEYSRKALKKAGWGDQGYVSEFSVKAKPESDADAPVVEIWVRRKDDRKTVRKYCISPDNERLTPISE